MKLTRTNRPFGLIIKLSQHVFERVRSKPLLLQFVRPRAELVMPANFCRPLCGRGFLLSPSPRERRYLYRRFSGRDGKKVCSRGSILKVLQPLTFDLRLLKVSGDHTARVTPVPIPNTVVKPRRADDTARASVWERRSSPGLIQKRPRSSDHGLFVFCPLLQCCHPDRSVSAFC